MAPETYTDDSDRGKRKATTPPGAISDDSNLKSRLSRKRTKTGCLTCRKRRIKCGEERPVCKNCIKSRRHCEGYNQRVVFKPPAFDYRPVPNGAHIVFHSRPVPGSADPFRPQFTQPAVDPSVYSHLRPRPMEQFVPGFHDPGQPHFAVDQTGQIHAPIALIGSSLPHPPAMPPLMYAHPVENTPPHFDQGAQAVGIASSSAAFPVPYPPPVPTGGAQPSGIHLNTTWVAPNDERWPSTASGSRQVSPTSSKSSQNVTLSQHSAPALHLAPWNSGNWAPRSDLPRPIDYQASLPAAARNFQSQPVAPPPPAAQVQDLAGSSIYRYDLDALTAATADDFLRQAAVETQDDDYYDVQSDEELEGDNFAVSSDDLERQRVLSRVLQINNVTLEDIQTRRHDPFAHSGILDHYRPEEVANPLRNPASARLFAHFISVTGPSLSIFERRPRNTSVLYSEGQVPFSQQGLWTYTMPMAALRHQGLLHAMLALASLHIARLHGASVTPSIQHYAWALKRIHSDVGRQRQNRLKVTTIAATMLLGFYEVMRADHVKWNMHLAGSKQLFLETDFVGMMRQFKKLKSDRATRRQACAASQPTSQQDELLDQVLEVDEQIVGRLSGMEGGHGIYESTNVIKSALPAGLDLKQFEVLKDLYWWYLKQDAYQSIVSGNPLLLDYNLWADCPPRAPLGQADAVYGSFDHLVLLLGRIADFAARDRHRKLKVMEMNGGVWKPAPGMNIPRPPAAAAAAQPSMATAAREGQHGFEGALPSRPPSGPQFYGMAPPPRTDPQMPASYLPVSSASVPPPAAPPEIPDLQIATQAALEEYGRIRAALHIFSQSLGDGFDPLGPEYQAPMETPFGNALFYRSYDIGCLWAVYNMAVIIAIRSHPSMHPAAHVAAGLAAHETSFFANEIGKIAAGMVPSPADQPLNWSSGAALCESCLPSFFAAIQYQSAPQRHATVSRIFNIAVRTGWGSPEVIANGCETSWVKAAAVGRGPPYQRIARREDSGDPRINGTWERLDPNARLEEKDENDRRLVSQEPSARLNWAIGIMGTEEDETMKSAG